jgi:Cof subfamily protein (haloacid dehalogenase superfamily)
LIRLIATDLDGTLLRSDGSLSDRTISALRLAHKAGVYIVLITGRPPRTAKLITEMIDIPVITICCNGALIVDLATDQIISQQTILLEKVQSIISRIREGLPGALFAGESGLTYWSEPAYLKYRHWPLPDGAQIFSAELFPSLVKLLVFHPNFKCEQIIERISSLIEDCEISHSGLTVAEISACGVHKGSALLQVCKMYDIPPDQTIAFGDMPNDIPLLFQAGRGVAVANAHSRVLDMATLIAPTNDEDGVAQIIEQVITASIP